MSAPTKARTITIASFDEAVCGTPVLATFARYYDEDGNMMDDRSLAVGSLSLPVAVRFAQRNVPSGAYRYQIFTAVADTDVPRILEDTEQVLHK